MFDFFRMKIFLEDKKWISIISIFNGADQILFFENVASDISVCQSADQYLVFIDDQKNLYVHCINVGKRKPSMRDVCHSFPEWIKRVAE